MRDSQPRRPRLAPVSLARASRGLSLIELTVATAILVGVMLILATMIGEGAGDLRVNMQGVDLEGTGRRVLADLSREIGDSGMDGATDRVTSHPRASTTTRTTITFQQCLSVSGTATVWGNPITYALSGTQLTRAQTGGVPTKVVASGVRSLSFTRAASADSVAISIGLERQGQPGKEPLSATYTSVVSLRNRP